MPARTKAAKLPPEPKRTARESDKPDEKVIKQAIDAARELIGRKHAKVPPETLDTAIILIPTFLWSVGLISGVDPLMYKVIWWGMGHSSQQINVSAHVAVWYAIAALTIGARTRPSGARSRSASTKRTC